MMIAAAGVAAGLLVSFCADTAIAAWRRRHKPSTSTAVYFAGSTIAHTIVMAELEHARSSVIASYQNAPSEEFAKLFQGLAERGVTVCLLVANAPRFGSALPLHLGLHDVAEEFLVIDSLTVITGSLTQVASPAAQMLLLRNQPDLALAFTAHHTHLRKDAEPVPMSLKQAA